MERSEMMSYSENIAIQQIEEALRKDPRKKTKILCELCGKVIDPREARKHGKILVCKDCWIKLNFMKMR